jgi:hypothetical protein
MLEHRPFLFALVLVVGAGDGRRDLSSVPPLRNAERGSGGEVARIFHDSESGALVIELAPVDLPAHTAHHDLTQPPVATLEVPASGALHGFRVEVVDSAGNALPPELLHHFNLIDPAHRELFLPISRRLLAAGRETGPVRLPRLLFGVPLMQGERIVASAMLENLTGTTYRQARVRLVMFFTPDGRPWPLYRGSPWQMDVAFPVGDKSFDLPPGRSSRSYEASPAAPGTIIGLGGHFHEDGRLIEFADVTTGEVIYRATPVRDSTGRLVSVPSARLYGWTRLGVHIVPEHKYRVTVHYENRSGQELRGGGMGVVGGLFIPDRGVTWPAADTGDSLYRADYAHYMRLGGGHQMAGMREKRMPAGGHGHH